MAWRSVATTTAMPAAPRGRRAAGKAGHGGQAPPTPPRCHHHEHPPASGGPAKQAPFFGGECILGGRGVGFGLCLFGFHGMGGKSKRKQRRK